MVGDTLGRPDGLGNLRGSYPVALVGSGRAGASHGTRERRARSSPGLYSSRLSA